jgi:hypothetical protein
VTTIAQPVTAVQHLFTTMLPVPFIQRWIMLAGYRHSADRSLTGTVGVARTAAATIGAPLDSRLSSFSRLKRIQSMCRQWGRPAMPALTAGECTVPSDAGLQAWPHSVTPSRWYSDPLADVCTDQR